MFDPAFSHDRSNPCAGQIGRIAWLRRFWSILLVMDGVLETHVITSPGDAAEADDQDPLGSASHSCVKYRATGQRS